MNQAQRQTRTQGDTIHVPSMVTPVVSFVLGTILSFTVFLFVKNWEFSEFQQSFEIQAQATLSAYQNHITRHEEMVNSIAGLFSSSKDVSRNEFKTFVSSILQRYPYIQGFSWNPKISRAEAGQYITRANQEGLSGFNITHLNSNGEIVGQSNDPEFVVVFYIEPYEKNQKALGFNIASHPGRLKAIEKARDTGVAVITERIKLVQEEENKYAYLLFKAIYDRGKIIKSVSDRRQFFSGLAVGVFKFDVWLGSTLEQLPVTGIDILIMDETEPGDKEFLHFHSSRTRKQPVTSSQIDYQKLRGELHWEKTIEVFGRKWNFLFTPAPVFYDRQDSWVSFSTLIVGLLLTSLLSAFFLVKERLDASLKNRNAIQKSHIETLEHEVERRRDTEDKLKNLIDSTNDWIWEVDHNGTYTYVSPAVDNILGYKADEILGKTPFDLMPAVEAKKILAIFQEILSQSKPIHQLININLHRNGREVILETNGVPFFRADGTLAGYRGIDRDVTLRIGLENELEEQRRRLEIFFDLQASLHIIAKLDGTIVTVNTGWKEYLGYEKQDLEGTMFFDLIHPDDIESTNKELAKLEEGKKTFHFKNRYISKQNEYRLLEWSAAYNGYDSLIYATANDVTEREASFEKLAELVEEKTADLNKARIEAENANLAKSQFLANMSHELRTPMHAIMNFSNLGLKKSDDEKIDHYFENIHVSAERLTALLNDLLDLSKLEAGKMTLELALHDLTTLIKASINEVSSLLSAKNISIIFDPDDDYQCVIDSKLMAQVMINLLSNAIKFSPQGSQINIAMEKFQGSLAGKQQQLIEFSLKDQGIGIPEDQLEEIFHEFTQSSTTRSSAGGTGLGLAISLHIIQLHNGRIWAESPPEGESSGSVFHVRIPVTQA